MHSYNINMVILRTTHHMQTIKIKYGILSLFLFCTLLGNAQNNVWDLKRAIDYAIEKNIQVKLNDLQVDNAENNLTQSWANIGPQINGSANHAYNIGRRIDPYTNTFANSSVRSNNFNLSGQLNLFSGLTTLYTIQQNRAAVLAATFDNEKLRNDVSVNVATAFLQVLFAQEQLRNAKNQLDVTTQQVSRNQLLFDAGTLARGALLDLQAQQANEELNVITAQNTYDLALLSLVQLLNLPAEETKGFTVVGPVVDAKIDVLSDSVPSDIYQEALGNRPEIKAADFRIKTNRYALSVARGSYYPSISFFGSVGTGYSQLQSEVLGYTNSTVPVGVTQSGEVVYTQLQTPITQQTPFGRQLDNNFNRSFGFSMNIPIFNGLQARNNVWRAKLNVETAKLNFEQAELTLRKSIEQAYYDARAAYKKYMASQKSLESAKLAFQFSTDRFDAGMLNSVDYSTAKTRVTLAESNLLQAKYDYLFKSKLLNFYRGKTLY